MRLRATGASCRTRHVGWNDVRDELPAASLVLATDRDLLLCGVLPGCALGLLIFFWASPWPVERGRVDASPSIARGTLAPPSSDVPCLIVAARLSGGGSGILGLLGTSESLIRTLPCRNPGQLNKHLAPFLHTLRSRWFPRCLNGTASRVILRHSRGST